MSAKTEGPVIVVFRRWRSADREGGSVFALFPTLRWNAGHITCYERVGQHGAADYHSCIRNSIPAQPEEYQSLQRELESIGYKLLIRTKYAKPVSNR